MRQGKTRKGSYAAYLDVSHPDIIEFLNIRIPTGDVQRKALNIHNAINITDEFMAAVINNTDFDLRDPKDDIVKDSVNARKLWERILEVRFRTGGTIPKLYRHGESCTTNASEGEGTKDSRVKPM